MRVCVHSHARTHDTHMRTHARTHAYAGAHAHAGGRAYPRTHSDALSLSLSLSLSLMHARSTNKRAQARTHALRVIWGTEAVTRLARHLGRASTLSSTPPIATCESAIGTFVTAHKKRSLLLYSPNLPYESMHASAAVPFACSGNIGGWHSLQ